MTQATMNSTPRIDVMYTNMTSTSGFRIVRQLRFRTLEEKMQIFADQVRVAVSTGLSVCPGVRERSL